MAVKATPAALEAIECLQAARGPLVFFQSGGCCDGSSPICLHDGELPVAPSDALLGRVGSAPFYVDREQYVRWGRPNFVLDVSAGAPEGFSLGPPGAHFVTREG